MNREKSSLAVGRALAEQSATALEKVFIYHAFYRPTEIARRNLGFVGEPPTSEYSLQIFELDGTRTKIPKANFHFGSRESFVNWLSQQSDDSLSQISAELGEDVQAPTVELLKTMVEAANSSETVLVQGPNRVEHPKGGIYEVGPVQFACLTKDVELFEKVLPLSSRLERQESSFEGLNALGASCLRNFVYGAEKLMAKDGPCCQRLSYCSCFKAAIDNKSWDVLPIFKTMIQSQTDLLKAAPFYILPSERERVFHTLGLQSSSNAPYLAMLLRDSNIIFINSHAAFREELSSSTPADLNEKDQTGWSPFLLYLYHPQMSASVVAKMISIGADVHSTFDRSKSTVDLLLDAASSQSKIETREALRILFGLGARSIVPSLATRSVRNVRRFF